MDIAALINSMIENMSFYRLTNDPLAGYGEGDDVYLGARYLPERPVPDNSYVETAVRYRSPIANHGTRYSPVQIKEGQIMGTVRVDLGYSDIGAEFTSEAYDQLIRLMQRSYGQNGLGAVRGSGIAVPTQPAMTSILAWAKRALVDPLLARNELDRWNAIVLAQVAMAGDHGFIETVYYANPPGHRVNAGGTWSDNSYDPWADIMAQAEFLRLKGYEMEGGSIVTSVNVRAILANNEQMKLRAGRISVVASVVSGIPGRLTTDDLSGLLEMDGLPPLTLYDKQYFTQLPAASSVTTLGVTIPGNWYLARDVMVFFPRTGRDEEIDRADLEPVVAQNVLGYVGVGRAAGEAMPGRAIDIEFEPHGKNRGIKGQAWQCSLPVVLEPEGVAVINSIA